jgi:nucleotide-binding universal stress UspA family protein
MKKILAAIKDSDKYSGDIARFAALLCKAEKGELFFVYVYEVPLSLPLDEEVPLELEKGEKILDAALELAEEMGVNGETHIIQARTAGAGIVGEIRDLQAELVVMGMQQNPEPGSVEIGSTPEYVLKTASCRTILIGPPQEEKSPDEQQLDGNK